MFEHHCFQAVYRFMPQAATQLTGLPYNLLLLQEEAKTFSKIDTYELNAQEIST